MVPARHFALVAVLALAAQRAVQADIAPRPDIIMSDSWGPPSARWSRRESRYPEWGSRAGRQNRVQSRGLAATDLVCLAGVVMIASVFHGRAGRWPTQDDEATVENVLDESELSEDARSHILQVFAGSAKAKMLVKAFHDVQGSLPGLRRLFGLDASAQSELAEEIGRLGQRLELLSSGICADSGSDSWRRATAPLATMPRRRSTGQALPVEPEFEQHAGYLAEGGDVAVETMTPAQAKQHCKELPGCVGFTYAGRPDQSTSTTIWFKSAWTFAEVTGWTSFKFQAP